MSWMCRATYREESTTCPGTNARKFVAYETNYSRFRHSLVLQAGLFVSPDKMRIERDYPVELALDTLCGREIRCLSESICQRPPNAVPRID